MTDPHEQDSIFLAATDPDVEEPPRPAVDDSNEAMRRLRHPFDVQDGGSRPSRAMEM